MEMEMEMEMESIALHLLAMVRQYCNAYALHLHCSVMRGLFPNVSAPRRRVDHDSLLALVVPGRAAYG
jgi:hypothetical protein